MTPIGLLDLKQDSQRKYKIEQPAKTEHVQRKRHVKHPSTKKKVIIREKGRNRKNFSVTIQREANSKEMEARGVEGKGVEQRCNHTFRRLSGPVTNGQFMQGESANRKRQKKNEKAGRETFK